MKKRKIITAGAILGCCLWMMFGCSVAGRLERHRTTASLSQLTRAERQQRQQDYRPQVVKLQRDSNTFYLAPRSIRLPTANVSWRFRSSR